MNLHAIKRSMLVICNVLVALIGLASIEFIKATVVENYFGENTASLPLPEKKDLVIAVLSTPDENSSNSELWLKISSLPPYLLSLVVEVVAASEVAKRTATT